MESQPAPSSRRGEIRPLRLEDIPELSALLRAAFKAPDDARFASAEMLGWKFLQPQAFTRDPLSYVMRVDGRIVAHAGLQRATMRSGSGAMLRCGTIIDWVADSSMPGAGIAVYRHAMHQSEATFLIGGVPATQSVATKLGFRSLFTARVYTRWVRPLREFLRRPKSAHAALRLLHGVVHSPLAPLAPRRDWSAAPVEQFDHTIAPVLDAAAPHSLAVRSVESLNHRLKCPSRSMRAWVLRRRGGIAGCALASIGAWEARILEVRLARAHADAWAAAIAVVTDALGREQRVCRISALTSAPAVQHALELNRYWFRGSESVSFYDPGTRVAAHLPIDVTFFDSDIDFYSA